METPEKFKSGFISIIGRPNVGKSTLLNQFLQQKISAVSDKPQTTRNRILAVKNLPGVQLVFIDTPGIHQSSILLNKQMVKIALSTLEEVDLILWMIEAHKFSHPDDQGILERLNKLKTPIYLLINKIDLIPYQQLLPLIEECRQWHHFAEIFPIAAVKGENLSRLLDTIPAYLPEGPEYFPQDIITDRPLRFIAAEFIREKVVQLTRQEIPYAVAVEIETYEEKSEKELVVIHAVIWVERESQKGIVVGKAGQLMKRIGELARRDLEILTGSQVFLNLWVKVKKDWRQDVRALKSMGYY